MSVSVDKTDRVLCQDYFVLVSGLCDGALANYIVWSWNSAASWVVHVHLRCHRPIFECVCVCPEEYRTGGLKLELELELEPGGVCVCERGPEQRGGEGKRGGHRTHVVRGDAAFLLLPHSLRMSLSLTLSGYGFGGGLASR